MMSLWDALRMNMMISYQELVRTFPKNLRIGGISTDGGKHLFGHVRNLRIWHKELTDAQMGESIK
ncbi:hypothetical protein [Escherichia coli]|uniref:hypothetical protein n=1 Tax=Escherichia coli TaxID=562 RepID=UPI000EF911E6|nr:hypothetical protein [Escherichia coli]RLY10625.1 hypothetical protein EAI44_00010 [Escherichia coli]